MKFFHRFLSVLALGLIAVAPAAAQTAAPAAISGSSVPHSVLDPLIGEPERHFDQAAALFIGGDNQGAASEIHAAAALIKIEAGREGGKGDQGLVSCADRLDQLAAEVGRGDVTSRRDLNLTFAQADLALAAHYRAMADSAIAAKQHDNAGRWLKAASDYVENASQWAGQPPPTVQSEAQDQARALETKIRRGANWTYDEAKKGVGYLGTQIQDLGAQMQKYGAAPSATSTGAAQ